MGFGAVVTTVGCVGWFKEAAVSRAAVCSLTRVAAVRGVLEEASVTGGIGVDTVGAGGGVTICALGAAGTSMGFATVEKPKKRLMRSSKLVGASLTSAGSKTTWVGSTA